MSFSRVSLAFLLLDIPIERLDNVHTFKRRKILSCCFYIHRIEWTVVLVCILLRCFNVLYYAVHERVVLLRIGVLNDNLAGGVPLLGTFQYYARRDEYSTVSTLINLQVYV